MLSSNVHPLEIDELSICWYDKGKPGRFGNKKNKVILGGEIVLNKTEKLTIEKDYSRVIDDYSAENFKDSVALKLTIC